jgi:hypothetical protein
VKLVDEAIVEVGKAGSVSVEARQALRGLAVQLGEQRSRVIRLADAAPDVRPNGRGAATRSRGDTA